MTLINNQLNIAKRYNLSFGLLMIDVDFFKKVNDTYGHVTGDRVLSENADAVSGQLRSQDVFASK